MHLMRDEDRLWHIGALTNDFTSSSQLSRPSGNVVWHSCPKPGTRLCLWQNTTQQEKKKKPDSIPNTYSLPAPCRTKDARTPDAELRSVSPDLGPKQHIATLPLHSFKFSHGASLLFILVIHHCKARHRAVDEGARLNRWIEVGTGWGAAFKCSLEI